MKLSKNNTIIVKSIAYKTTATTVIVYCRLLILPFYPFASTCIKNIKSRRHEFYHRYIRFTPACPKISLHVHVYHVYV